MITTALTSKTAVRPAKVTNVTLSGFDNTYEICYNGTNNNERGKMFYYEVKFANGDSTVILSAGDPTDEVPAEFQGDITDIRTICEVSN